MPTDSQTADRGPPRDAMQEFADKIIASLEAGIKPWVRPWDENACGGPQGPINAATGDRYHGINTLILGMDMRAFASGDPRWATYKQAGDKGWQVKKGEKSTTVFFYKPFEVEDAEAKDGKRMGAILKHFAVFHASQIEGIPPYKAPSVEEAPWACPEAANIILKNSGAIIREGGDRAFYSPVTDHIQLPPLPAFRGPPEYAATALHELAHWTGHEKRLNRSESMKGKFGSAAYAMEELRAELSSAFISAELGIPTDIPHHASYIENWLKPLKKDKREIFRAAADAQRIVDMVLGFHPEFVQTQKVEPAPERPVAFQSHPLTELRV